MCNSHCITGFLLLLTVFSCSSTDLCGPQILSAAPAASWVLHSLWGHLCSSAALTLMVTRLFLTLFTSLCTAWPASLLFFFNTLSQKCHQLGCRAQLCPLGAAAKSAGTNQNPPEPSVLSQRLLLQHLLQAPEHPHTVAMAIFLHAHWVINTKCLHRNSKIGWLCGTCRHPLTCDNRTGLSVPMHKRIKSEMLLQS